jgi:hypothetical protein
MASAGEMKMMIRMLAAAAFLGMTACQSGGGNETKAYHKVFEEDDRQPAKSAGYCNRCNYGVYEGHRCKLTVPCALCKREAGAGHLHEVQWVCGPDSYVMARQHECYDAKACDTCRQDKRNLLGPVGCERCFRPAPPTKVQGITSYCGKCNLETGANHVCGVTRYCVPCLRESGPQHKCDVTRFCPTHDIEHAPDHVHGTTAYCRQCHRDAGEGHKHGITEWCWRCSEEVEWPHSNH